MRIQHNIMALNSSRQLGVNNSAVSKSLEKLSSGYRINRAGDDAAGLAISEKMRAQIKGLTAASDNSQDAISLVQTAEGGLQEVHSMLNRMQELATKSSNGTYTDDVDRRAYQDEISALKDEINRIADSTNFNGIKLLDGSMGIGTAGVIADAGTDGVATAGTKFTFEAPDGYKIHITTDDGVTTSTAAWGTGADNKTLTISLAENSKITQSDLDALINGLSGTPAEAAGKIHVKVNQDFMTKDITAAGAKDVMALSTSAEAKQASNSASVANVTVTANKAGAEYNKTLTVTAADADPLGGKLNADGSAGLNLLGTQSYSANDLNKMLSDAGIEMTFSFDGTKTGDDLTAAFALTGGAGLSAGGGLTLQIGDTNDTWNQLDLSIGDMHVDALGLNSIDIGTRDGASAAISKITDAINQVSTSRGKLGAIQNRLEHTINNLGVTTENITAAESRIRDVDMAKEMMEFTKNSVLMQSAQAMLAQANQQPQSILQLLQ